MNENNEQTVERWLEHASRALQWPEVSDLVVRSGQVWSAQWDDVVSLVLIDGATDARKNFVRVAPVTIGQDDADDSAVILSADNANFATALTVWPELVRDVAEVVLDRLLVTFEREFATLASLTHAVAHGDLSHGLPILNERSPRRATKLDLQAAMDVLAAAADMSAGDDTLEQVLAPVMLNELVSALSVSKQTALKILRGSQAIDRGQAEVLAPLVGRTPEYLMNANPSAPGPLLDALTELRRGPQIRALAQMSKRLESDVLRDAVAGTFALAARGEKQPDWDGRATHYLSAALAIQ